MKARMIFQRMTSREKTLLCAFVWVILIVCFAFALRHFSSFAGSWRNTGRALDAQEGILVLQPQLAAQLKQELEFFSSDQILDSAALTGRVDQLAREVGIPNANFSFNPPRSEEKDIHVEHTIRLNIRNTSIDQLMALDAAIDRESPYINKVSVSLSQDRGNKELLDATFLLNSFELKPSVFQ